MTTRRNDQGAPLDPRDNGGRNESGQNDDTRIAAARNLDNLKSSDVKAQTDRTTGKSSRQGGANR